MKSDTFANVDDYISRFPPEDQKRLEQMRKIVRKAAPEATETISYNIPAYKQGRVLVYFALAKNHLGFYPTSDGIRHFEKALSAYRTSKGAIQFPLDKPLPAKLIAEMVQYRVQTAARPARGAHAKAEAALHYHKDGSLWAKGTTTGGEMHGYWEWYRKDGSLMRSGYFDHGQRVGRWTTYDKQGKVYKVTEMKA